MALLFEMAAAPDYTTRALARKVGPHPHHRAAKTRETRSVRRGGG